MITLRNAEEKDCRLIYGWRNHPDVRRHFFNSRNISYPGHEKWFFDSLKKEGRTILVACENGREVGIIRFDVMPSDPICMEIDIYVDSDHHGRGLGKEILNKGEKWITENTTIRYLVARVKPENEASVKMFEKSGFISQFVMFRKKLKPTTN